MGTEDEYAVRSQLVWIKHHSEDAAHRCADCDYYERRYWHGEQQAFDFHTISAETA